MKYHLEKKAFFSILTAFCIFFSLPVHSEEDTIYDVINREDMDTFSDMVVLGFAIDDVDGDGYTPLMIASSMGKARFVRFLLHNGANISARSYNGMTALIRAAQGGHNDIIDMLYKAGANLDIPDFRGDTALMWAVRSNRRFTVEKLVALGADVNYQNANQETAIQIARKKRFDQIAIFLKSKGAR